MNRSHRLLHLPESPQHSHLSTAGQIKSILAVMPDTRAQTRPRQYEEPVAAEAVVLAEDIGVLLIIADISGFSSRGSALAAVMQVKMKHTQYLFAAIMTI